MEMKTSGERREFTWKNQKFDKINKSKNVYKTDWVGAFRADDAVYEPNLTDLHG